MIDLKLLRADPERVRASQHARGEDAGLVDALLTADADRRAAITVRDGLRSEQKVASDAVRSAADKPAAAAIAKNLKAAVTAAEETAAAADEAVRVAHLAIPNVIAEGVPPGGEQDFRVLVEGVPGLDGGRDHLEIGELLGAIDTERGAKVSGSRFYFLTGVGAFLELALLQLAMQHAAAAGFTPVVTPALVKPESMEGTGFLGAHADEVYRLAGDDLYLVGTSEVPLAAYRSAEVLDAADLPLRYAGFSPCFRREAGSYGKDTRGIIRVHQFDKVELFAYTTVAESWAEHERILGIERAFLDALELPYRVIEVAAGDLGSSAARKYDIEAWLPSQRRWLELTSASNCTDFQARRLATRIRADGENEVAATLNGTLCAMSRTIVALLENHQRPDGSVTVPEALRPGLAAYGVGDVPHPRVTLPEDRGLYDGPPPRLVASDLDGTLLRTDNTASPRSRAALDRVVAAGARLVLVTGRPARWMVGVAETTGHHGVALVSNGAAVFDLTTETLLSTSTIAADDALEMAVLLRDRVPDATFAAERPRGYVREAGYRTPFSDVGDTEVVPWQEVVGEPLLKLLVRAPSFDADGLLRAAREVVGEHLGTLTHSSREGLLEISAAGVSKASALAAFAAQHDIPAESAVAFGDMPNDIPMFAWAGRSWAVASAHPMAKAAASAVTGSLTDDGVAVVLERLFPD